MALPPLNGANGLPNANQAAPSMIPETAPSLFSRVLRFTGIQPKPRVDLTQGQEHMAAPSRLSFWKPSTPTLNGVLKNWVAEAEGSEKSDRRIVVKLMKQAGAELKNGKIIIPYDLVLDNYRCPRLTSLPENLEVVGSLYLTDCTGVTSLPENLAVGRNLILTRCTRLMSLPENLEVGDTLYLTDSTGLTSLPENLAVGGDLKLYGCTGLASLPENLKVGGVLVMHFMNLNQAPENLEKAKSWQINLNGNQIRTLPDRLGQLRVGTELFVEGNPIPAAEIVRFRAAYPHINLRADEDRAVDQGSINVHDRNMVIHFQTLYRKLNQVLNEKNIPLMSTNDTQNSLRVAAQKYNTPDALIAIQYMLVDQDNRTVMDFEHDVTSSKVLTSAWTLVQSQASPEDRNNGTENLVKHLAIAEGHCSTRHAEETLLALQDSYGLTLQETADEQRVSKSGVADEPQPRLTTEQAYTCFLKDIQVLLNKYVEHNAAISDEELLVSLRAELYNELVSKNTNVESLDITVNDLIDYLAQDWSTFVENAKEAH